MTLSEVILSTLLYHPMTFSNSMIDQMIQYDKDSLTLSPIGGRGAKASHKACEKILDILDTARTKQDAFAEIAANTGTLVIAFNTSCKILGIDRVQANKIMQDWIS